MRIGDYSSTPPPIRPSDEPWSTGDMALLREILAGISDSTTNIASFIFGGRSDPNAPLFKKQYDTLLYNLQDLKKALMNKLPTGIRSQVNEILNQYNFDDLIKKANSDPKAREEVA